MINTILKERVARQTITRSGKFALSAQVTPGMGANLVSFKVDGKELIFWDEPGFLNGKSFTGAFNMFPTPCRLDNCSYVFEGRKIIQKKHGQDVFIHGLIRDENVAFDLKKDSITSTIAITPDHPIYEGFPYSCEFSVTHRLIENGLEVAFRLANNDKVNIPFGYGIHPFWKIHGGRDQVSVRVPCDYILELKNLVPTGEYSAVEGTDLDLRTLRNIKTLFVDNAFWKRRPGTSAEVVFRALKKRMVITASDNFPHMIVYAPEGQPFVCVENLTTCPNAPNLVSAGKGDVANMLVAAPNTVVEGWIRYSIESIG